MQLLLVVVAWLSVAHASALDGKRMHLDTWSARGAAFEAFSDAYRATSDPLSARVAAAGATLVDDPCSAQDAEVRLLFRTDRWRASAADLSLMVEVKRGGMPIEHLFFDWRAQAPVAILAEIGPKVGEALAASATIRDLPPATDTSPSGACLRSRRYVEPEPRGTFESQKAACEQGDSTACWEAGLWLIKRRGSCGAGEPWYRQSCDMGNGYGCAQHASLAAVCYVYAPSDTTEVANPMDVAENASIGDWSANRGCELGNSQACGLAGRHAEACAMGNAESCNNEALAFEGYDPKRAIAAYQRSCDAGLGVGCQNLGRMYWKGLGVTADARVARVHLLSACDRGLSNACWMAKQLPKDGSTVPAGAADDDDNEVHGFLGVAVHQGADPTGVTGRGGSVRLDTLEVPKEGAGLVGGTNLALGAVGGSGLNLDAALLLGPAVKAGPFAFAAVTGVGVDTVGFRSTANSVPLAVYLPAGAEVTGQLGPVAVDLGGGVGFVAGERGMEQRAHARIGAGSFAIGVDWRAYGDLTVTSALLGMAL